MTKRNDPCAEFDDLLDHEIEARIKGSIWPQDKSKRAQQCLDHRALARKKAEQAGPVRATWAGIIIAIIIASIGGLYTIWPVIDGIIKPKAEPPPASTQDKAQADCGAAAFKDYNNAGLALLKGSGPLLSVDAEIAKRRLEEQYCQRLARCMVADPAAQALEYTATFSSCLKDEILEYYDAVPRTGDD